MHDNGVGVEGRCGQPEQIDRRTTSTRRQPSAAAALPLDGAREEEHQRQREMKHHERHADSSPPLQPVRYHSASSGRLPDQIIGTAKN